MKTLILYGTKYGTSAECAAYLAEKLKGKAEVMKITKNMQIPWQDYTHIIIGGSVYIGRLRSEVVDFMKKNEAKLLEKKLGIFICCMAKDDDARKQLEKNFPESLVKHASAKGLFGGAFLISRMGFIDRTITKKVSGISEDSKDIRYNEMDSFLEQLFGDE